MSSSPPRRSRYARIAWKLASAIGIGAVAASAPASARSISPQEAPAEWLAYASDATTTISKWLEAESESAMRLRAYLNAMRPASDQPTAPLLIKVWINADGTVSRIDHAPFAHAGANADLKALIVGGHLDMPPPEDILLPLRILVQIPPAPEDTSRESVLDKASGTLRSTEEVGRSATGALGLSDRGGLDQLQLQG
ncbi:hypothetical protein [Sphingopyxis sp. R3-92]|uniref:hypothetical protein n=1 Tax=Sphingopyxis sp. R3-92 TaxID=3158553 RepID=UPI003EE5E330